MQQAIRAMAMLAASLSESSSQMDYSLQVAAGCLELIFPGLHPPGNLSHN
jgi:hypothetical protein